MAEEVELTRKALVAVGSVCIAQHKCSGPGCDDIHHRRDIAYWREMARMLGLIR